MARAPPSGPGGEGQPQHSPSLGILTLRGGHVGRGDLVRARGGAVQGRHEAGLVEELDAVEDDDVTTPKLFLQR
jgi:hypothetical protein